MSRPMRYCVLSGGLGGARLALALTESDADDSAVFITNVADDWLVGELPVCPDTDAVIYALTGRFDEERGWGIVGDDFPGPRAGEPGWFGIGRLDRRTHDDRARLLNTGLTLAATTAELARNAGARAVVIPVTEDPVRTQIRSGESWLSFQEWLVRDRCPAVDEVRWAGLEAASASPGVLSSVVDAAVVVVGSSSPIASLLPIVKIQQVREALLHRTKPTVALSPVVLGRPIVTSRDAHRDNARRRLLAAAGVDYTPLAIAQWLSPLITHFIVDPSDAMWVDAIADIGVVAMVAPVIGDSPAARRDLMAQLHLLDACSVAEAAS
jgi:LPPG:FO 2-phospho-L-lactate transferase